MKSKPIIIVAGEPYGIFLEVFFKIFKKKFYKNYKFPIILIGSKNIITMQMKKFNYNFNINTIKPDQINRNKLTNRKINLIDVNLNFKRPFGKITSKSSKYIKKCFEIGIDIMKKKSCHALINGPISKKHLLDKKFNGITEYLAHKTYNKNKEVMLIYNKSLSVCPVTTHMALKNVSKKISSDDILNKITTIYSFYKKKLKKIPRFAITGLNPHCETKLNFSEEKKIIIPAIKRAKNMNINVQGPLPTDTLFMKNIIKKYDVVLGMYHDQVITPMKTIYGFKAINITLGLPFIRISPDHGTNNQMLGKNKSNSQSLQEALIFLKKIR